MIIDRDPGDEQPEPVIVYAFMWPSNDRIVHNPDGSITVIPGPEIKDGDIARLLSILGWQPRFS